MSRLINVLLLAMAVVLVSPDCFATWSIIIVDPVTKEIGIAGASCTYNCYGIGSIAPGEGAIIVQAMSNNDARAEGLRMIFSNVSPEEIIDALHHERFDPERQQYAVVTLQNLSRPATYTGIETHEVRSALTGVGISVQGNTLAGSDVIQKVYDAALDGRKRGLSLHEILMLALEAGAEAGGDKRCGEQRATTAFLTVSRPDDNVKRPYLKLVIFGQKKGGQNAVRLLRTKYDRWCNKKKKR